MIYDLLNLLQFVFMAPDETWPSNFPLKLTNFSEIQHVLLWKERLVALSGRDKHPTVTAQCQALVPLDFESSLLPLLYLHAYDNQFINLNFFHECIIL